MLSRISSYRGKHLPHDPIASPLRLIGQGTNRLAILADRDDDRVAPGGAGAASGMKRRGLTGYLGCGPGTNGANRHRERHGPPRRREHMAAPRPAGGREAMMATRMTARA